MTPSPTASSSDRVTIRPTQATSEVWYGVLTPAALPPDQYYPDAVPILMSREEEHLFTSIWREGEREAMADMTAGNFKVFDSDDPDDVVRWLLDLPESG